ncbi:phosphate ABC transporter permease [Halostagnicola larsenii XH-48]|uniref:Phosphate ABC transporter permease n=1 Tax=Halostagnicola larsenii XH-48 TaxID=797299 RepID=W0JNB4_9EURY|nr:phosphonate ABC transporter, permease protein PhnE [Halostagnicola larsenii]AHG00206.1 phosphate ABC transporter permease [Halostagnicola larsenii XH-48]
MSTDTDPSAETVSAAVEEQYQSIQRARRRRRILGGIGLVVLLVTFNHALTMVELSIGELIQYAPNFFEALGQYFPRTTYFGFLPFLDFMQYVDYILEENLFGEAGITLAIGFGGTILGFPLALLFAVLGSGRVTPFPFNFLFRGVMSSIRAIPALVWALIYIPLGGVSAFTATIAVATDTVGNLGRLFTDELEEVEDGPIEAIRTTGAGRIQVIIFGMLSQVYTPFIAWTLYIFEINIRIAVGLGIIGAGGIGYVLNTQQRLFAYTNMMATIIVILVLIISVEIISQRTRSYIREDEEPMGIVELLKGFPKRMAESLVK